MNNIIDEIAQGCFYDASRLKGYTQSEFTKISKLYDIEVEVNADFFNFLLQLGRCDGGLIGDDPIIFIGKIGRLGLKYFFRVDYTNV